MNKNYFNKRNSDNQNYALAPMACQAPRTSFFFNNFIISPHLCISTSLLQEQKQAKAYNIAPEFKRIVEWRYQLLVIKAFLRKKGNKN